MSDMQYPKDPVSEKELGAFVLLCVKSDGNYKQLSDKIVKSCVKDSATPIKSQKAVVDKIKEIVKAGPKKHAAIEKFYCLKLLNKIILKKNLELNKYIEIKIMDRLTIFAEFNNNKDEKSAQSLLTRGKNIFGVDEKDQQSSANFLIILLDCIEKWALTFQFEDLDGSAAKEENKFYKCYRALIDKGVKFPSTFKQQKKLADQSQMPSMSESMSSMNQSQSAASSQGRRESQAVGSVNQTFDDNESVAQSISAQSSITPEKKSIIAGLKKKMQSVKEASKKAKKCVESDFAGADAQATLQMVQTALKTGEESITNLMSDDIAPHISNAEALLEKMFGYQEALQNALVIVQDQVAVNQALDKNKFQTGLKPPEKGNDMRLSAAQPQNEDFNFQPQQFQTHQQNPHAAKDMPDSSIQSSQFQDFNFSESGSRPSIAAQNPYEFQNHAQKDMFATQIHQNAFQDFNFGEAAPSEQEVIKPSAAKAEMIQPRASVGRPSQVNADNGQQRDSIQPQNQEQEFGGMHKKEENESDENVDDDEAVGDDEAEGRSNVLKNASKPQTNNLNASMTQNDRARLSTLAASKLSAQAAHAQPGKENSQMSNSNMKDQGFEAFNFGSSQPAQTEQSFNDFSFPAPASRQESLPSGGVDDFNFNSAPVENQGINEQSFQGFNFGSNPVPLQVENTGKKADRKPHVNADSQEKVAGAAACGQDPAQSQNDIGFNSMPHIPQNDFNFGMASANPVASSMDFNFGGEGQSSEHADNQGFNFGYAKAELAKPLEAQANNINQMNNFNFGEVDASGLNTNFNMEDDQGNTMTKSVISSQNREPGVDGSAREEEKKQMDEGEHYDKSGNDMRGYPGDRHDLSASVISSLSSSVAAGAATAGTTVISLISNMISMKTPEPGDKGQSQSSVAHSSEHHIAGGNVESSSAHKPAPPVRQSQLAMAGPSPQTIRKTDGDDDEKGSNNSDEVNSQDEEGEARPEQNQTSRNASQEKMKYQISQMPSAEEMKSQVDSETERRIEELKIVLSADKVVKWWARIPQGCLEVTQPFKDPLMYQQQEQIREKKDLEQEVDELRNQVSKLKKDKQAFEEKESTQRASSGKDAARVAALEFEIDSHNTEMHQLKSAHAQELARLEEKYIGEQEALQSHIELIESLNESLKRDLQEEREKISGWEEQEQEFKDKIQGAVQALTSQLNQCREELKEKTRLVDNFAADRADLESQAANLRSQLQQEIEQKSDMELDIGKLKQLMQSTTSTNIDPKYFATNQTQYLAEQELDISSASIPMRSNFEEGKQEEASHERQQFQSTVTLPDQLNQLSSEVLLARAAALKSSQNPMANMMVHVPDQSLNSKPKQQEPLDDPFSALMAEVGVAQKASESPQVLAIEPQQPARMSEARSDMLLYTSIAAADLESGGQIPASLLSDSFHHQSNMDQPDQKMLAIVAQDSEISPLGRMMPNQTDSNQQNKMAKPQSNEPSKLMQPGANQPLTEEVEEFQLMSDVNRSKTIMAAERPQIMVNSNAEDDLQKAKSFMNASRPSINPAHSQQHQQQQLQHQPSFFLGQRSASIAPPSTQSQSLTQSQPVPPSSQFAPAQNPAGPSMGPRPTGSSNTPPALPSQQNQPVAANPMAQQFQQNLQQQLLVQKLQSFHINSLLQGDKCVVYEDVNIKIGCIRQISYANGKINVLIKLFMRNHNTQNLQMNAVFMKIVNALNPNLNTHVKISRSSQPLPLRVPQSQPLGPNETIDLDVQIQWLADPQVQGMGLGNLKLGNFNLQLFYELSNGRKSGNLPVTLPLNILHILAPMNIQAFEFKGLWDQIRAQQKYPNCVILNKSFSLDLQKAQNMGKLRQIVSLNGTCFSQINDIEPGKPNIVGFAAQLSRPELVKDTMWVLIRLTLTKDGNNCGLEVQACRDNCGVSENVMETLLGLIAK